MNNKEFAHQIDISFNTRKNKRYGRDAMTYEMSWVSNLVRECDERDERSLRIDYNYAFLAPVPRWREIMATEFKGRYIDHEICEVVIPGSESVLSPYTYNNRKSMGSQAAINQLIEHIYEVSNGYTEPCRIIKLDFSGYFPNAWWDVAYDCVCDVIGLSDESEERKAYLKWLAMISVHCNPAGHFEYRTPKFLWDVHIDPAKSILTKDPGIGAAIGRLIWQTAMGLYVNDEIIWLTDGCGMHLVCFVDDIVLMVPNHLHQYALSLIPELRKRLAKKGVRLNEKKFYDQPYEHGVEFLGSHIKPMRIHLNDKTYNRAVSRVVELNSIRNKEKHLDEFMSSMNSYTGLLKGRTEHKRITELKNMVSHEWLQYVEWNESRQCFSFLPEYTLRERFNKKFNLNFKHHDKTRNQRPDQCATLN